MLTFLILLWLEQRKNAKRSKRHHRRYKTRPVFRNRGILGEMTLICEMTLISLSEGRAITHVLE